MSFRVKDYFYKKAKKENYLARSVYKLEEIDKKFKIFKLGDRVLDLGYYPGSWMQYASRAVGKKGCVIGVDLQPVNRKLLQLENVKIYQKGIHEVSELESIQEESRFDVILSDMAPQTTGIKTVDQARSLELVERVFGILPVFLQRGGSVVAKIFDGQEVSEQLRKASDVFDSMRRMRPHSTPFIE